MSGIETLLDELKRRITTNNRILLTAGSEFVNPDGFFIEVPTGGGDVTYTTYGGQTNTETMSAGYHPTMLNKIWTDTAIDLVIIF